MLFRWLDWGVREVRFKGWRLGHGAIRLDFTLCNQVQVAALCEA